MAAQSVEVKEPTIVFKPQPTDRTVRSRPGSRNTRFGPSSFRAYARSSLHPRRSGHCANRLEAEDEHERLVDGSQLERVEPTCRSAEPSRVDESRLLHEDTRLLSGERDRRPKARRTRIRRGRRYEQCAQIEKLVGLHDHGVPGALLFVTTCAPWRRESEDLSADHSVSRPGCELCELFADDAHLLAVASVRGEHAHLLSDSRPEPSARRRLPQCHAHGFRVAEFAGTHDFESCSRRVVEADMQGASHIRIVAQNVLQKQVRPSPRLRPKRHAGHPRERVVPDESLARPLRRAPRAARPGRLAAT